ncbi:MAG: DUF1648 domain-containing protein [Candidatus Acidiferrum sp.]
MDSRLPKMIFVLLAVLASIYFWSNYAQLPEVVASHFNARSVANGWQPKSVFFEFFAGTVAIAAFLTFGISAIISRMPVAMINLPNREYWLAPDHREETLAFLSGYFAWFGCAALVVAATAVNYAVGRNLHPEAQSDIPVFLYVLGGFLVLAIASSIRVLKRFSRVPSIGFNSK